MGKQRNLLTYALVDLTMLLVLGGMIPSICQAQGAAGVPDLLAQPAPARRGAQWASFVCRSDMPTVVAAPEFTPKRYGGMSPVVCA